MTTKVKEAKKAKSKDTEKDPRKVTYVIRIDGEIYDLLQKNVVEPFGDTPNTVLRRLLKLGQ